MALPNQQAVLVKDSAQLFQPGTSSAGATTTNLSALCLQYFAAAAGSALDQHHQQQDVLYHQQQQRAPAARPSNFVVWTTGLSFVSVISLCSVTGIIFMRCLEKSAYSRFITFFVSLGVGSLSGSAVFHLIPQAFGLADEFNPASSHDYLNKSLATVIGIYLFFFSDKAIKLCLEARKRSSRAKKNHFLPLAPAQHNHRLLHEHSSLTDNGDQSRAGSVGNSHQAQQQQRITEDNIEEAPPQQQKVGSIYHEDHQQRAALVSLNATGQNSNDTEQYMNRQAHSLCVHDHDMCYREGDSVIATVAWMIIFGDGLHNFIDGVSIGASFSESILGGVGVSVAVFCEEFPHELGDVAILINAGMSVKQALVYNLLSAVSCYVGFAIGVFAGNIDEVFASYTFGFAGGMFLYISMACMMPEMKNAMEQALHESMAKGLEVLAFQASGLIIGVSVMFTMARFGGAIQF